MFCKYILNQPEHHKKVTFVEEYDLLHDEDLAKVIIDSIENEQKEINAGGPEIFSQNEIAVLALKAFNKPIKLSIFPIG